MGKLKQISSKRIFVKNFNTQLFLQTNNNIFEGTQRIVANKTAGTSNENY